MDVWGSPGPPRTILQYFSVLDNTPASAVQTPPPVYFDYG